MKYAIIFNFSPTQWIIGIALGKKDFKKSNNNNNNKNKKQKKAHAWVNLHID